MMSSIDNPFGVILVYPPKLPDKYFMKWLREKISENKIRLNFSFDDKSTNVTDFIKNEIDNWNNNSPVFISAQTGVGKNYFIREELLPKLIDKYHNEKNLILLLSNRIALTRQTKLNFAERLVKFTHNDEHLKKIQNFFTPDGVDNLYIDFDVITICSYHQMYSRKLLDSTKFKYIVCDECHFFTSDSTFNPDTDNMLNEIVSKGQTSTRIYMSATPETAFEPIIRKEYKVLEDLKEQMKNALENRNFRNTAYSLELLSASLGNLQAKQNILRDNASAWLAMQDIERWHLELNFYCMGRNYDYIKKIFSYKTVDKLAEIVASSNDKWIIFSNRNGRNIADELKNKDVEVLFLSRDTLKCPNERNEYNQIIENETTNKKVIVSTSLLDNGININNSGRKNTEKIFNIVIDTTDRIEFIQMLGRIRANKNDEINLYIKEQSIQELKKILLDDTEALIVRLSNDFLSLPEKQVLFKEYPDIFYFTNKENFSDYNECCVYFLVDRILNILNFIKNYQHDFYIEFVSSKLEALKSRVYDFYKNNDGKYKSWSKNIVDILESETGNKLREEYKQKALTDRIPEHLEVYNYVLQDSFIRYIFSVLIPQYYDKQAEDYLNYFVQMLSESEKNYFNTLIKYTEEKLKKDLSIYEKIKLLCENTGNPIIKNNVSLIKNLEETSGKYRTYFETTPKNFLQVILQWIEKFNVEPVNIDEQFKMEETIEEIIKSKAVTSEEIQKNIKGKSDVDKPTLDKNFLKEHGILKDSDEANGISRKYFDNQSFTSLVRKREIFSIDGKDYRLKSYIDNTSQHNSYYLFEIVEDKLQDQENEQPSC